MAVNLTDLSSLSNNVTSLGNIILVTPNVNNFYNPQSSYLLSNDTSAKLERGKSFVFHQEGENSITLDADITDHVVESNKSIQDQVSIKPVMVSVQGFIGELNDITASKENNDTRVQEDKLKTISAYAPSLSNSALKALSTANQTYDAGLKQVNSAKNAYGWSNNSQSQNKQQTAFNTLYASYQSRTLFTIQTPWMILSNMVIKTIRAVQNSETRMISDFEITFKQITFAETKTVLDINSKNTQGRLESQASELVKNGVSTPPLVTNKNIGSTIQDMVKK